MKRHAASLSLYVLCIRWPPCYVQHDSNFQVFLGQPSDADAPLQTAHTTLYVYRRNAGMDAVSVIRGQVTPHVSDSQAGKQRMMWDVPLQIRKADTWLIRANWQCHRCKSSALRVGAPLANAAAVSAGIGNTCHRPGTGTIAVHHMSVPNEATIGHRLWLQLDSISDCAQVLAAKSDASGITNEQGLFDACFSPVRQAGNRQAARLSHRSWAWHALEHVSLRHT